MIAPVNTGPLEINPIAILAAILFRAKDVAKVSVQHDDSKEATEVLVPFVQIEKEGTNVICSVPFRDVINFATIPYSFAFKIVKPAPDAPDSEAVAVISFSKVETNTTIVSASGKPIVTGNPTMDKLMERLMGAKI